ncbi:Peptidyl-prolyl cis-trans isomerase D [Bienertia sinuspersici]
MYRRAMAVVGLGRHEWAYWNLEMAAEMSPSNQKVIKKLEEVRNSIHKKKLKEKSQGDCPKGLGLGLPTYSKKTEKCLWKEKSNDIKDYQDREPSIGDKEGKGNNFSRLTKEKESESSSNLETIEDTESRHSFQVLSNTSNDEKNNSINLKKSTCRFLGRKRHGDNLLISKSKYLLISLGKTLKFYNAKVGSFMEVRIISKLEGKDFSTSHYHH